MKSKNPTFSDMIQNGLDCALKMNFKLAKEALSGSGVTITRKVDYNEYRVNYVGGAESSAYYTEDVDDAYDTAQLMALTVKGNDDWRRANGLV